MSASAEWRLPQRRPRLIGPPSLETNGISAAAFLRTISAGNTEPVRLDGVLRNVVEFVSSIVECDSCLIYVLQGEELVLRASKNPHPDALCRIKLKIGQGVTGWVAEHKEPAVIPQAAGADPRFKYFNELPEDRYDSFLSVPLLSRGNVVGVLNLQNRDPYHYSHREIELVSIIGLLVGAEIEMARLEEENLQLSERLESRTLVERAKGLLQRDLGINESQAYQTLQRESQRLRRPMKEIAEAIVLSQAVKSSANL